MKHIRRVISFVLVLVMVIGMVPLKEGHAAEMKPNVESVAANSMVEITVATESTEEITAPTDALTELTSEATAVLEKMKPDKTILVETMTEVVPKEIMVGSIAVSGTCGDNLTWELYDDGRLLIFGNGEMSDYSSKKSIPWYNVRFDISQVEIAEGVTSIGNYAFSECTNLLSISIPDSVTSIGRGTFSDCNSLASIGLPKHISSLDNFVFYNCTSLSQIRIPDGITSIGEYAFYECSNVAHVELPGGITSIGDHTFSGCSNLVRVEFPDSVTSIGPAAFSDCTSLTAVELPEQIVAISKDVFKNCTSLSEIVIPDGVTSIGSYAFYGCNSLSYVEIPDRVSSIGDSAFRKTGLTSVVIPGSVRYIGTSVFLNCSNLTSITIEYGVTSISQCAFQYLDTLRTVVIPDSVTKIEPYAFEQCISLSSIVIPEFVTDIGQGAFRGCSALSSVEIPESITNIGTSAFAGCRSLNKITFCGNAPVIGEYAFSTIGANSRAYYPENNDTWTDNVKQTYGGIMGWSSYKPCSHQYVVDTIVASTCTKNGYTSYICSLCERVHKEYTDIIPHNYLNNICTVCGDVLHIVDSGSCGENVNWILFSDGVLNISGKGEMTSIPWHNLRGNIYSVVIEDGIKNLCKNAFAGCVALKSIVIPNSVIDIGRGAFQNCSSLAEIVLPEGICSIEEYTYCSCTSLVGINIPNGVTNIGSGAFSGCASLTSVEMPDSVVSIGSDAFSGCASLTSVEMPDSVVSIGSDAFSGCASLTSVEIPDNVRFLSRTFYGCSALQSVKLPKNLLEIGSNTFEYCYALSSIDIPDGVVHIGKYAFNGCKNLKTASIPDTVQVIGESAFWACEQLTNIVIPYGVQAIWERTFADCHNLQSISIPVTVKTIENNVFQNCDALTDVYYTGSEEQWNNIFFFNNTFVNTIKKEGFHYLETEQYDDTLIENEIQLKAGGQANYIDRFLLPTSGQIFYDWLEESTDGDGQNDVLIYDVSEYCPGAYTYKIRIPISCDNTGDLIIKLEREKHALVDTLEAVYNLFRLEHWDVSWLSTVYSIGLDAGRINDTEGYVEIGFNVYISAIEKNRYYDSIDLRDRMITEIISYIPENSTNYEKIRYFNAYLARSNCYNSDYPNEPSSAHRAVTALEGNTGSNGPVCDAYARAFKLLCESQNIPCAIITGIANNDSHAWNLVQMEDGNWYAVDVTWNDPIVPDVTSPVSGYEREDYLLIGEDTVISDISFSVSHQESGWDKIPNMLIPIPEGPILNMSKYIPKENTEHIPFLDPSQAVKPTCTENGLTSGTYCYICNEMLSAHEVIPALGHDMGNWTAVTETTCTENGSERRDCSHCDHYETRIIEAPGHSFGEWFVNRSATCMEDGENRRNCNACSHYETEVIPATGHSYESVVTAPTCVEQGYTTHTCANCGDSYADAYVDALGHAMSEWTIVTEATCTEGGSERRDCSRCDHYEIRAIEAAGHSYEHVVTAPTCTAQGYTTHTCSACGDSYVDTYVDALGHNMGEWATVTEATCTENGSERRDCSLCDHYETRTIKATGHSYELIVTAPTCVEQGYTTHTCTVCGDSYVDSYVDAMGHDMGEWETVIDATCTEDGQERRECTRCDHYETRIIEAPGHSYDAAVTKPTCTEQGYTRYVCGVCGYSYISDYVAPTGHAHEAVVTDSTCTEQGYTTYICHCGDRYVSDYTDPLGHDMGAWEISNDATCTEDGQELRECSHCDHSETREIEALGHEWDEGIVTVEPTEETEGEMTYTCERCSETRTEIIPALEHEHRYEAVITDPTCIKRGYTTHTCRCGDSYVDSYVDALGHDMGEWFNVTEPTCTDDGLEQRDCSRCDYNETQVVEATGHDYESVVTDPTCIAQGFTTHTCHCGDSYTDSYTAALGHSFTEYVSDGNATCTQDGTNTSVCDRCDATDTVIDEGSAHGHDFTEWTMVQKPTETVEGLESRYCLNCGVEETRTVACLENPFVDVPFGAFYYEPVMWAVENGITNGTSATTFGPNDQCMRAHVVTFLWRTVGSPEPKLMVNPFVDVKPTDFYYKPVLWALENGITSGMDATHFGPTAYCNRAQVVTFLYRTMGSPDVGAATNPFTDVAAGSFYEKPVLWAVENGVTAGLSATSFGPNSICNRAQIVTFLYRAFVD